MLDGEVWDESRRDAALITGGRNVESPYFGFGRQLGRRDYIDLDAGA